MLAIAFAAPPDCSNDFVNGSTWSIPFANTNNADCAERPTSSFASAKPSPAFANFLIFSATGSAPAPNSEMIRRNDVPACEPLMPALAITANIAVVSSIDIFAEFATGATYFIDSANFSMSNADVENDFAITSVTRPVSDAFKPNARNVEPATSAARAKSVCAACAKYKVDSVTLSISLAVKPNFANSTCNPATCFAENTVDAPNFSAFAFSFMNSSAVAPDIARTFAISNSKPWNVLIATAPNATIGAVMDFVRLRPTASILRPVLSIARSALFNPPNNGAMLAKNRRLIDERFICRRTFYLLHLIPHRVTIRVLVLVF